MIHLLVLRSSCCSSAGRSGGLFLFHPSICHPFERKKKEQTDGSSFNFPKAK
uniref:Uncharacterized protein n=1 Tax=Arundo donax TaxID=35708 RepID=A0A0A9H2N2_ARUDO